MTDTLTACVPPTAPRAASPTPRQIVVARGRNVSRLIATIVLLATFAGCMWMYTRHNAFPIQYHPDEDSKATQILSEEGERNFNHPQLLLETTQWAVHWLDTPADPQAVVVVGRTVSATLAAIAVVALSLCGYLIAGLPGLIAVTPMVALCPFLLAYSHAMKEDASLVFGTAIAVLGACLLWAWGRRPALQWLAVVVLAAGVALASSAKYVGVVTLALAVLALPFAPRASFVTAVLRPVAFISYVLLLLIVVNHRALSHFEQFNRGLDREFEHSTTHHSGLTMAQPNGYTLAIALDQTPTYAMALLAIGLLLSIGWWRGRLGWDRCIWLFTGIFLLLLSHGVIPMPRYALPIVVLAALLAGLAAARLGQFIGKPWGVWGVPIVVACITVAVQLPRCLDYVRQFGDDSRQRLREFVLTQVPRGSYIFADSYAGLDAPPYDLKYDGLSDHVRVSSRFTAGDGGSLENLRRRGVTHVAVANLMHERYFDPHVFPVSGYEYQYNRHRGFYEELFRDGKLIWSQEASYPMRTYNNPQVRLYSIERED
ncbi:MAG TPA: hypothetical protein VGN72_06810 [Tepidisphaeraceae bacterium]|jgi:hypothetical protein|nr:hypothetical protein [Tepidisphaeraceae bacterium]